MKKRSLIKSSQANNNNNNKDISFDRLYLLLFLAIFFSLLPLSHLFSSAHPAQFFCYFIIFFFFFFFFSKSFSLMPVKKSFSVWRCITKKRALSHSAIGKKDVRKKKRWKKFIESWPPPIYSSHFYCRESWIMGDAFYWFGGYDASIKNEILFWKLKFKKFQFSTVFGNLKNFLANHLKSMLKIPNHPDLVMQTNLSRLTSTLLKICLRKIINMTLWLSAILSRIIYFSYNETWSFLYTYYGNQIGAWKIYCHSLFEIISVPFSLLHKCAWMCVIINNVNICVDSPWCAHFRVKWVVVFGRK